MLLALKYRPRVFSDVVGQKQVVDHLTQVITLDRHFSSHIFAGPFGSGKTTVCRIFAQRLLCLTPQGPDPCFNCAQCKAFAAENNSNYREVDGASAGLIENIRQLREEASYFPTSGAKYRIILIDECHQVSRPGQDALLKTLEEGPPHAVWMLATTAREKIHKTIASRSLVHRINFVTTDELTDRLVFISQQEGFGFEKEALKIVASHSRNHVRDAIMLLDQISVVHHGTVTVNGVRQFLSLDKDEQASDILLTLSSDLNAFYQRIAVFAEELGPQQVHELFLTLLSQAFVLTSGVEVAADDVLRAGLQKLIAGFGDRLKLFLAELRRQQYRIETICDLQALYILIARNIFRAHEDVARVQVRPERGAGKRADLVRSDSPLAVSRDELLQELGVTGDEPVVDSGTD